VPTQTEAAKNLHQQYGSDCKVFQLYLLLLSNLTIKPYYQTLPSKKIAHIMAIFLMSTTAKFVVYFAKYF
ncbi:hypothetical protein, partial [Psychrobacter arcticus]|uniref:hypothetical protein n=1 Tax=Psychrobacter arcticus TaxID=334543 RepID=UPI001D10B3B9